MNSLFSQKSWGVGKEHMSCISTSQTVLDTHNDIHSYSTKSQLLFTLYTLYLFQTTILVFTCSLHFKPLGSIFIQSNMSPRFFLFEQRSCHVSNNLIIGKQINTWINKMAFTGGVGSMPTCRRIILTNIYLRHWFPNCLCL